MPDMNEKGISLLFVILMMTILLGIGLGLSTILIQQTKMLTEAGYSVVSFYSADSGIEQELYDLYKLPVHQPSYQGTVGPAFFTVTAVCRIPANCFEGFTVDSSCAGQSFCLKSIGEYKDVQRAIEVTY